MDHHGNHDRSPPAVRVAPVSPATWRAVAGLRVEPEQTDFVALPSYYLALCCFSEAGWAPLSLTVDAQVVGFLMWAVDPDDGACWLGGIMVDAASQGRGIGQAGVAQALRYLADVHGHRRFALSYAPDNHRAKRLYARLGFEESGEREDDEVVARLRFDRS